MSKITNDSLTRLAKDAL